MPITLRFLSFACALLFAAACLANPDSVNQEKAVLAGLSKESLNGTIASWKVNILNISGDWAFVDVTPLDKRGRPLAEQKVAVLHHVHDRRHDGGWKELNL
jgi:hypothetical protein